MSNTKHTPGKPLTNPKYQANEVAKRLRYFRAATELEALNGLDKDRIEVIRQIDWSKYSDIIQQLEFLYKNE